MEYLKFCNSLIFREIDISSRPYDWFLCMLPAIIYSVSELFPLSVSEELVKIWCFVRVFVLKSKLTLVLFSLDPQHLCSF